MSPSPHIHAGPSRDRDQGSILPMVLVITVVLGMVIAAVATYTTTGLRYGNVVEARADRLAAADGGQRYAVGRLEVGAARLCATGGTTTIVAPSINAASVTVTCGQAGDGFNDADAWALILTGEGIPAAASAACSEVVDATTRNKCGLLNTLGGSSVAKSIAGPIYMANLRFNIVAPLTLKRSQILYSNATCPTTPGAVPGLSFDADSLGYICTTRPWSRTAAWSATADPVNGLFTEPNRAAPLPTLLNPAYADITTPPYGTCRVFRPGRYTTAPNLRNGENYFKSGNYLFEGFELMISNSQVIAGRASGVSGDNQVLNSPACNAVPDPVTNPTDSGATFYLKNDARFSIGANGKLEILRRKQGSSYVSMHTLDTSLSWDERVIHQQGGTNKEMYIHGLVWAPHANALFSSVTNAANGQLLGGAVLSNIDMRSSAVGEGFVISVAPSDLHGKLRLDSVATLNGKTTSIRSIVDYRPSTGYTAVTSWRVID